MAVLGQVGSASSTPQALAGPRKVVLRAGPAAGQLPRLLTPASHPVPLPAPDGQGLKGVNTPRSW